MYFWKGKKQSATYGLLIDISSGSIGASIVISDPEKEKPTILYTDRVNLRISADVEHAVYQNVRRVREALLSSFLNLYQRGFAVLQEHDAKAKISDISVTCSSPWAYTVSRNVNHTQEKPFKVTGGKITSLVHTAEKELLEAIEKDKGAENKYTIVENATVDITVNGYKIADPNNLKGTEVGLTHVIGAMPYELISGLEELQDTLLPQSELKVHTFMLVMYCVLQEIFPDVHSACVIDITGEATEFGIIENDLLIENNYIQEGSNTMTRNIARKSGKPLADARTALGAFSETETPHTDVDEEVSEYICNVQEVLGEVLSRRVIPEKIILTAHRQYLHTYKTAIETALHNVTSEKHSVITIEKSALEAVADGNIEDTYLAISAAFFHKLGACSDIPDED